MARLVAVFSSPRVAQARDRLRGPERIARHAQAERRHQVITRREHHEGIPLGGAVCRARALGTMAGFSQVSRAHGTAG